MAQTSIRFLDHREQVVTGLYVCNFLVLPTGQILFTDFSRDVEVYTPSGTYNPSWAPRIQSFLRSLVRRLVHHLRSPLQWNVAGRGIWRRRPGRNQLPPRAHYNLATGDVFYSHTHDHSSMAVAFNGLVSTHFDVPANQELGPSQLVVVANGIPSQPVSVNVQ